MNKKILIVEDDRNCEVVLSSLIRSVDESARIEWADSVEQALYQIEAEAAFGRWFDLVISDIFLAGTATGIELWRTCRERYPTTAVLLTSSLERERYYETIGPQQDVPRYLAKPYHLSECRRMLEAALS